MFRIFGTVALLGSLLFAEDYKTFADFSAEGREKAQYMTISEYEALKESGEEVYIVDIRDAISFEIEHIAGALNLGRGSLEKKVEALPKDAYLLVYCSSGTRASISQVLLKDTMGYENAFVFGEVGEGGLVHLIRDGMESVKYGNLTSYISSLPDGKWSLIGTTIDLNENGVEILENTSDKIFLWKNEESRWIRNSDSDFEVKAHQGLWIRKR